jgi:hypothetical protein
VRLDSIVHIGQGMQTGRNDVFGGLSESELLEWRVPDELWYKRAANSDIQRYLIMDRQEYILYLENVNKFSDLPPDIQRYLQGSSKLLKDRAAFKRGNCEWWKYTWPLHKDMYRRSRILCPYLATSNRFALDEEDVFLGLTDTTVLFDSDQPEDMRYLLGLLNSRLLTFRFRSIGKLKSGGILEYFWNSISKLPIRRIDFHKKDDTAAYKKIVQLVDRIQTANKGLSTVRTARQAEQLSREIALLDNEIERIVCSLYDIEEHELAVISAELDQVDSSHED